jgi:hypothetical protein
MQDTKDTFFATLRNRIAAGNPARTIVVRGIQRPGVLVVENELPTAWVPPDVFLMSWTGMRVDHTGAVVMVGERLERTATVDVFGFVEAGS